MSSRLRRQLLQACGSRARPAAPLNCPVQDREGVEHAVIFGGRTFHAESLNDAWDVTLTWPNATWRELTPQQPEAQDAPSPRKGHSAVLVPDPKWPLMVRACWGGAPRRRGEPCSRL